MAAEAGSGLADSGVIEEGSASQLPSIELHPGTTIRSMPDQVVLWYSVVIDYFVQGNGDPPHAAVEHLLSPRQLRDHRLVLSGVAQPTTGSGSSSTVFPTS